MGERCQFAGGYSASHPTPLAEAKFAGLSMFIVDLLNVSTHYCSSV
ncbi:hypothetical protein ACCUM_2942 [Candidatus Accumulibacter phosphatis]|uniref:Uncharacterized protein n=1 Tax=Candidatus Accumulibacter phosphatis TaxID=327160 RepID=A0A5S4F9Y5_9PROT|nr:hypothetical protein ACCUM_2942 [Candidatus Accumulibacter phosphatis]